MALKRRRQRRRYRASDYDTRGAYIGSNKASAWEKRKYGSNYKRGTTKRRRRRNPAMSTGMKIALGVGLLVLVLRGGPILRGIRGLISPGS